MYLYSMAGKVFQYRSPAPDQYGDPVPVLTQPVRHIPHVNVRTPDGIGSGNNEDYIQFGIYSNQ